MFTVAFLIGIFSYLIFLLGIAGLLYRDLIIAVTVLFWGGVIWFFSKKMFRVLKSFTVKDLLKKNKLLLIFVILFVLQAVVNLIGTFGPELAFDALWYHLTLPKLYLANHSVFFIPGGLLYYSAMPKLAEMLYIAGLSFGNEILVKLIHFTFGLLTCLVLYKLSRKFFTPLISLIGVVIFYSNLVVAWESITAYVDLVRAFFEVLALWAFVNWYETKEKKWFVYSAVMVGLAITTKVLATGSIFIFLGLIVLSNITFQVSDSKYKENFSYIIRNTFHFIITSLAVPLPWFVFSYMNTGNPFYPFFSSYFHSVEAKIISVDLLNPFHFISVSWNTLIRAADPLSPIYLIFLPLLFIFYKKLKKLPQLIFVYCIGTFIFFYITSGIEGARLLLPYLPAFSLICAGIIDEVLQNKKQYGIFIHRLLVVLVIVIAFISISYRFAANYKYLPIILGQQTKGVFLTKRLNFSFGDFYDTDGYFKNHIKPTDNVLLYGFHNLYYVDFPFIDATWREPEDVFNFIATQRTELPEEFHNWVLIYQNEETMVKLYKAPERLYSQL